MYYPKIYQKFMEQHPDILSAFEALGRECRNAGPIPEKYQNLIKIGIAIGANARGAIMSGIRKAMAKGATHDEVLHTALLSLTTTGFPNMMAAMSMIDEVIQSLDKDPAPDAP